MLFNKTIKAHLYYLETRGGKSELKRYAGEVTLGPNPSKPAKFHSYYKNVTCSYFEEEVYNGCLWLQKIDDVRACKLLHCYYTVEAAILQKRADKHLKKCDIIKTIWDRIKDKE